MNDEKTRDKVLNIIHRLHLRTRDGSIQWREGDDARGFVTELGDFTLVARRFPDPAYPDEPDYGLQIFNTAGREIETISNVTLRPVMDRITSEGLNPYVVLQQIYEMARRQALRVDDALESILRTLNEW